LFLPFVFSFDYNTITHYTELGIFMQKSELLEVSGLVSELEQHFGVPLTPMLRSRFMDFVLESFPTSESFATACWLVAAHDPGYGRFPPFARFLEAYQKNNEAIRPEYNQYKDLGGKNLLPPAQERGVFDRWTEPVTGNDIERLKAKVVVSEFFKASSWGPRYLQEAIAEAEARGIDLETIGVIDAAAHDRIGEQPRGFERGDRRLRSRDDSFTAA
jgi:hypothetical protein